jgi:pimeloyl-ACP methyl ester carboxylesterase
LTFQNEEISVPLRQSKAFAKQRKSQMCTHSDKIEGSSDRTNAALRRRALLRALRSTSLILGMLSAAGAGYEAIAGLQDAARHPAPGQLVDVGGHRLQITCVGRGSPVVILDAGLGGTSRDWVLVQAQLSTRTRVCAYDRAGMGWSDAGPRPRSPARLAEELHVLLAKAEVPAPYLIVAHSLSGKSARLFAASHPDAVAGMVLIDTRSERIDAVTTPTETRAFSAALKRQAILLSLARRLGLARLLWPSFAPQPDLPPGTIAKMALLQTQPKSLRAATEEGLERSANDRGLSGASLGAIPLVVIAAGDSMAGIPGWGEAQAGLAALSSRGRLVVAEESSHLVQIDRPEIVIEAVQSVLVTVRTGE